MINYSIIIPHKNIPDLLQRCLDSIPRRNDVQIIVVDDNSEKSIVDFDNFPGLNDPYVEVYFTTKGKGAGYARNVGMKYAKGKWLIFADADDMFLPELSEFLDFISDSNRDAIVFNYVHQKQNGTLFYPKKQNIDNPLEIFVNLCMPWGKLIKREVVVDNKISFQEVKYANDVMFSVQLGAVLKNVLVVDDILYKVISRQNSLCTTTNWQNYYCRIKVSCKAICYVNKVRSNPCMNSFWEMYWGKLLQRKPLFALFILPRIFYSVGIKFTIVEVFKILKKDYPKYFNLFNKTCNPKEN